MGQKTLTPTFWNSFLGNAIFILMYNTKVSLKNAWKWSPMISFQLAINCNYVKSQFLNYWFSLKKGVPIAHSTYFSLRIVLFKCAIPKTLFKTPGDLWATLVIISNMIYPYWSNKYFWYQGRGHFGILIRYYE